MTPEGDGPSEIALTAADRILRNLDDRSGFDGWYGDLDEDIQEEIRVEIAETIDATYRG